MTDITRRAGVSIARKIYASEAAIDATAIEIAALIKTGMEGASACRMPAHLVQPEFERLVGSLAGLAQVRGGIIDAHRGLEALAIQHGISWRMDGSMEPKERPPTGHLVADKPAVERA